MSYKLALDAINLIPGERLGHTEYCSNYALVRAVTGLDPVSDDSAWGKFHEAWDIDFLWSANDGPSRWHDRGRVTDMGHAEFLENGSDKRVTVNCPFKEVEEVWDFDATVEYGLDPADQLVKYFEDCAQANREDNPDQLVPGGRYKTLVSGAIDAFGWDMLLAAAADREKFEKVLDSFFRYTLHQVEAQAKSSVVAYLNHDDFVWTAGAFMHPDFYRAAIIPRYKKLWDVLHDAGKKVLFCSDGNFMEFVDDIVAAGADGLIFEPCNDLDYIVERYGKTKSIFGSKVDCRTLTFGKPDQIKHEIDETLKIAKACPGFFFAVGNHIPSNVPVDNGLYYFDHLSKNWRR